MLASRSVRAKKPMRDRFLDYQSRYELRYPREPVWFPRCPSSQSRVSRRCAPLPGVTRYPELAIGVECLLGEERRATTDNEDNMFIETKPPRNVGTPTSRNGLNLCRATAIQVQERPRRAGNPHRGEGIQVHRHIASARPSARLHQYGRGGHDPLSLLRDRVPLRSSVDTVRCRPAGQLLC
jgi:hypothetical protein